VSSVRGDAEGSPSLSQTVGAFCQEMLRLRGQLHDARLEIRRLKDELGQRSAHPRIVGDIKLRTLRRQVAFYCHPDRGGDERLMQQINALFDDLECAEHVR
jgi:hypothetical protein